MVPLLGRAAEAWRTFTDTNGRQMVARIVRVEAERVVVELKANGQQVPLELAKLSPVDVLVVMQYKEAAPAAKPEEPRPAQPKPVQPKPVAPASDAAASPNSLYPRTRKEIETGIHEIAKRAKPDDLGRDVHEATKRLNIYRFLCGVPSNVKGDSECSKHAEDAALTLKKNGGLSHSLGHSTGNCNISTIGNVVASVGQYMEDGGANNRDARGHRAWCLNPPMGKVGFGSAGERYSAMWCMDGSGTSLKGPWAYPGMGLFPIEYLHGNAWSVYGTGIKNKPKVEMFRLQKRPEQALPPDGGIPGKELKVNYVSTGMNAINFEPGEAVKRGIYWVRVSGEGQHTGYLVELY